MIQNRQSFLQAIANRLGRETPNREKPQRIWQYNPQHTILKDASPDDLVEMLVEHCKNIHTTVHIIAKAELLTTLQQQFQLYEKPIIIYEHNKIFQSLTIDKLFQQYDATEWNYKSHAQMISTSEKAKVSVVVSDITLAESATVVVQCSKERGRVLSFLPENSIAIIPKSSIVPRMTQAAQFLRAQPVASCINFITGPSNSADIEMNLVVGVHGPVTMTYIIVEDL